MVKPTLELFEKFSAELDRYSDTNRTMNDINDSELKEYMNECGSFVRKNTNISELAKGNAAAISAAIGSAIAAGGSAIGIGSGVAIGGVSAVAGGGIGAVAGSAVPAIGTIIGGIVGFGVGRIIGANERAKQNARKMALLIEITKKSELCNRAIVKELAEVKEKIHVLEQQNMILEERNQQLRYRVEYLENLLVSSEAIKKSLA